ncbi:MAG: glycosyltransferase [Rhodothermales bacterium]
MLATLYALAMVVLLLYGGNLLVLVIRRAKLDRLREGRAPVLRPPPLPESPPHVVIQLPIYNEPPALVARLLEVCVAMDYPPDHLEVQVLDDSTDGSSAAIEQVVQRWQAAGVEVLHVRRTDRVGFKAGALDNGLKLTRAQFVAVFDADFLPDPDFLRQMLPAFEEERIGLVQARWGHLNADASLLTQIQAYGLDAHFAMEQYVRHGAGCFMNFNGTAGIWRIACIDDAGGWHGDTLAEDLDLSYRAQLRGWCFRYRNDVSVPAELPTTLAALRTQQFRWTKGAAQVAQKLLGGVMRSRLSAFVKAEAVAQLTAPFMYPFLIVAILLHVPLLTLRANSYGPSDAYFAALGVGLLGFAGFALAHLFTQRDLYPDWPRRLWLLPLFMAGSMGMALRNTGALWSALRGRITPFVRTPKSGATRRIAGPRIGLEVLFTVYCLAGLGVLVMQGDWAAVPFQLLFTLGFGLIAWMGYGSAPALRLAQSPTVSAPAHH